MKQHTSTVCFQVTTHSPQPQPHHPSPSSSSLSQHQDHSSLLQQALQEQASRYDHTIDELHQQISILRQKLARLQLRNEKDQAAQKALRVEYNQLYQRLSQKGKEELPQEAIRVVEVTRDVPVEVDNPVLVVENGLLKDKTQQLLTEIEEQRQGRKKLKSEKGLLQIEIQLLKKSQVGWQQRLTTLRKELEQRDRMIQKLTELNAFYKNNKQVVTETKHILPEWHQARRVEKELQVETVYVDRPVEKMVLVEIPKVIRHFVQPERAVVNRVINCAPASCACEEMERIVPGFEHQIVRMNRQISDLQQNVSLHNEQKRKLVGIIAERDSQLNLLETKIKLMHTGLPRRTQAQSQVRVEVRRVPKHSQGGQDPVVTRIKA